MAILSTLVPKIKGSLRALRVKGLVNIIQRNLHGTCRIGNRDVVGHGPNGMNVYKDDSHYPFPAIRFREPSLEIQGLRLREKGDWNMLCKEEKKALYRASFCQTYAEFQASTGLWKLILGMVLFVTSFAFWMVMFYEFYVYEPLPSSLYREAQEKQLRRMIDLRVNPIDGLTSRWNYEEDRWKKWNEE